MTFAAWIDLRRVMAMAQRLFLCSIRSFARPVPRRLDVQRVVIYGTGVAVRQYCEAIRVRRPPDTKWSSRHPIAGGRPDAGGSRRVSRAALGRWACGVLAASKALSKCFLRIPMSGRRCVVHVPHPNFLFVGNKGWKTEAHEAGCLGSAKGPLRAVKSTFHTHPRCSAGIRNFSGSDSNLRGQGRGLDRKILAQHSAAARSWDGKSRGQGRLRHCLSLKPDNHAHSGSSCAAGTQTINA